MIMAANRLTSADNLLIGNNCAVGIKSEIPCQRSHGWLGLPRLAAQSRDNRDLRRWIGCLIVAALLNVSAINAASAANGSVVYTYDALGRLTVASYDTGVCILYTYDAVGNRLSQTIGVGTSGVTTWGCFLWGQAPWTLTQ